MTPETALDGATRETQDQVPAVTAGRGHRVAVILSEIMAPWVFAGGMPPLVGILTDHPWWKGGLLGLGAALLSAGIPYALILRGVRRGRLSDRHVGRRQDRPLLLAVVAVLVLASLALVVFAGASQALVALVVVMIACVIVGMIVSLWWKLSMHAVVATASVTGLGVFVSPWMLLLTALILPLGWARVRLQAHSPAQVFIGAMAGATIASAVILAWATN